jgi:hypothetical protein
MAFEELPTEYEAFFKSGGELPASLLAEHKPAPVATPQAVVETPAEVVPPVVPEAKVETPAPAPVVPENPFAVQLLQEKERQLEELNKKVAELTGRIDKAAEVAPPDKTLDPLGYMTHQMEKLQAQIDAMTKAQTESQTQTQQQKDAEQFMNTIRSQVQAFEKATPDYQEAYKHLMNTRMQDFTDLGMTKEQIQQNLANEEMLITRQALAAGKNPAELVYSMAKRYGFKAAPAPVAPENKLETIKKGMEASKTVDRSTPPDAGKVTLETALNASDRDLNVAVDKHWEELFGTKKGIF